LKHEDSNSHNHKENTNGTSTDHTTPLAEESKPTEKLKEITNHTGDEKINESTNKKKKKKTTKQSKLESTEKANQPQTPADAATPSELAQKFVALTDVILESDKLNTTIAEPSKDEMKTTASNGDTSETKMTSTTSTSTSTSVSPTTGASPTTLGASPPTPGSSPKPSPLESLIASAPELKHDSGSRTNSKEHGLHTEPVKRVEHKRMLSGTHSPGNLLSLLVISF
jgi:hypothetical protein